MIEEAAEQQRPFRYDGTFTTLGRQAMTDITDLPGPAEIDIRLEEEIQPEEFTPARRDLAARTPRFLNDLSERFKDEDPGLADQLHSHGVALFALLHSSELDRKLMAQKYGIIFEQLENAHAVIDQFAYNTVSGLPNRAAFEHEKDIFFGRFSNPELDGVDYDDDVIAEHSSELAPDERVIAYINIDLDHVKDMNDAGVNGHDDGDEYLGKIGTLMGSRFDIGKLRDLDPEIQVLPSHFGGDEYIILLETTPDTLLEAFGIHVVAASESPDSPYFEMRNPQKLFGEDNITRTHPDHEAVLESVDSIHEYLDHLKEFPSLSLGTAVIPTKLLKSVRKQLGRAEAYDLFDALHLQSERRMATDKFRKSRNRFDRGELAQRKAALLGVVEQSDETPQRLRAIHEYVSRLKRNPAVDTSTPPDDANGQTAA